MLVVFCVGCGELVISFSSLLFFACWGRALWDNADGEGTGYMLLYLLSWRRLLLLLIHIRLPKSKEHAE